MKRTDACIAGHYRLTIGAPGKDDPLATTLRGSAAKDQASETAVRAGAVTVLAEASPKPQRPDVRHKPADDRQAALPTTAAADFRNVVILNAVPGAESIFRHDR
jgi:hypothetical protein